MSASVFTLIAGGELIAADGRVRALHGLGAPVPLAIATFSLASTGEAVEISSVRPLDVARALVEAAARLCGSVADQPELLFPHREKLERRARELRGIVTLLKEPGTREGCR